MSKKNEREVQVSKKKDLAPDPERMSLYGARKILEFVVSTHEDSITELTPLDQVAGVPSDRIREAASVVTEHLLATHEIEDFYNPLVADGLIARHMRKDTPQGKACFSFSPARSPEDSGKPRSPKIGLTLEGQTFDGEGVETLVLTMQFPLGESGGEHAPTIIRFTDARSWPQRISVLQRTGKNLTLAEYKLLFKGVRWLFANMLEWDKPGIILPEQLEHLSLQAPKK